VSRNSNPAKWLIAAVIFAMTSILVASPYLKESFAVDRCLDHGGSYDYLRQLCDYQNDHAYLAWYERHPYTEPLFWLSSAISILALATWLVLRRRTAAM
jgi:hypothetical protein